MAPPGVNTFYDQLDMMTISNHRSPPLLKSPFSSPSTLKLVHPPTPPLSQTSSWESSSVSSVYFDHDYVLKPAVVDAAKSAITRDSDTNTRNLPEQQTKGKTNHGSDAMLSSCAIDHDNATSDDLCDTDFLQDLDDLDFCFDDLDPCGDVTIEDSFQDFIDSALEKPSSSYFETNTVVEDGPSAVILQKEDFLGLLGLQPVQRDQPLVSLPEQLVLHSPVNTFPTPSFLSSDLPPIEAVPTKKCSCSSSDSVSSVIYSTAHRTHQGDLRVCPSTVKNEQDNVCSNCSLNVSSTTELMSPLFVDTSFQPITDECLDILMDDSMSQDVTKNAADLFDWLNENQNLQKLGEGGEENSMMSPIADDVSDCSEKSSQCHSAPLDLESFMDLEDFTETSAAGTNRNKLIESPLLSHDHTYQKTEGILKSDNKDLHVSQLKLSFLAELSDHMRDNGIIRHHSDYNKQSPHSPDSVIDDHCDMSVCPSSPWELKESSSAAPSPLSNMECSNEDSDMKSHLALLNLFSDENAPSLLHTESVVPNIRFV